MKVLYNTESQAVSAYPRADDEPVVGLDPLYLVLSKVETPAPSPTAAPTWEVDLDAMEYRQSWTEPEPPPPAPDWTAFNATMLQNPSWQAWTALLPLQLVMGIVSASTLKHIEEVQSGLAIAYQISDPGPAFKAEWQAIANANHVPVVF